MSLCYHGCNRNDFLSEKNPKDKKQNSNQSNIDKLKRSIDKRC